MSEIKETQNDEKKDDSNEFDEIIKTYNIDADVVSMINNNIKPANVLLKDYERFYWINPKSNNNEVLFIDKHFNGLYLIGISRQHIINKKNLKINKITFDIGQRTLSDFDVKGKRKTNAIKCGLDTKICKIICNDFNNKEYNFYVHANVKGKIIDINREILNKYELIKDRINGYIAIIQDSNHLWGTQMKKRIKLDVTSKLLNKDELHKILETGLNPKNQNISNV